MDDLSRARAFRARDLLNDALEGATAPTANNRDALAKAFSDAAFAVLKDGRAGVGEAMQRSPNELVRKAGAHVTTDDIWSSGNGDSMATAYIESVAELSLLDSLARHARIIPMNAANVLVAADAVGNVVAEGLPKPVRKIDLSTADAEPIKSVGMVVLSSELARSIGGEGRRLFERELTEAVARAANGAVLAALIDSNAIGVAGTGDILTDIRAGLRAAPPSTSYVVAAPAGDVADLATRSENKGGMGVRGGTFAPGIEIVAIDGASDVVVIPASRIALWLGRTEIRASGHAAVDMRDTPESPAQLVSLWQTNSLAMLVERHWRLASAEGVVIVGAESP